MAERSDKYQSAKHEGHFGTMAERLPGYSHMNSDPLNIPPPSALHGSFALSAPSGDIGTFEVPRNSLRRQNTSHVPCKFFRQGTCHAGSACRFSHDLANTNDNICKYFAMGNCKFGLKCANAHILPDGRRVNSKQGQRMDRRHLPTIRDSGAGLIFEYYYEEDHLPETLKDLMTPQEKGRRGVQNTKEGKPIDSGTGISDNETPSKFGSARSADVSPYLASPPRQSSLSIISEQLQRTRLSRAEASGDLHPTPRISSSPIGSGPAQSTLEKSHQVSNDSISQGDSGCFTPPINDEQGVFSTEAMDEDEERAENDEAAIASRMAMTTAVPIITENRKRREDRAAESEKGERDRNFQLETSRFGSPLLSTASLGKALARKYPTYEDIGKPENREFGDEGVRVVEVNEWVHPAVPITSTSGKQPTTTARAGAKNLHLENEEAQSSWFEAEREASKSEKRSSCSSSWRDSLDEDDDREGDSRSTSWDSEDNAELQALKRRASRFNNPLGCGDTDSGLRNTILMGNISRFSESKLPPSIRNDTGPPSQNSSITDSTLSEDATDWGEDSDVESCEHQLNLGSHTDLTGDVRYQSSLFQSTLEPVKKRLLDRLMEEFWIIFNQRWPAGAKQCSPASNSATNSPSGSTFQTGTRYGANLSGSQEGGNRDEHNPDENPDKALGGNGKQPESPSKMGPIAPGFACPYRKRDPRKYCVRDWRSCALGPHKTVARVKAHLYRCHTIYQCQRCKSLFDSDDELDSHIMKAESCDAILAPHVDGITKKIKEKLQCKRKAYPGQTEAARWKQIYQILFPDDEEVPDPFFEPIRDNENNAPLSSDLTSLTNYEDFLRRVLPGLVKNALETQMSNQIQPIEEGLRGQIVQVIEQAQNRAFHDYRSMMDANHSAEPSIDSGYVSNPSMDSPYRGRKGKEPATSSRVESSMPSRADLKDMLSFPESLVPPFVRTDPSNDFQSTADVPRSFPNMNSSTSHRPAYDVMFGGPGLLPLEDTYSSNVSLFSDQFWGSMPNTADMEYLDEENERDGEE